MKILLTGATGTVGLATLKHLLKNKTNDIAVFDIKSRKVKRLLKPFKGKIKIYYGDIAVKDNLLDACKGIDVVIHLAAIIPPLSDDNPSLAERVNVNGTRNLLELVKCYSPGAFFIYGSSISVYGDRLQNPSIKVSDPLIPSPGDEYAKTKLKAEQLIKRSGLTFTIFRITAVMGASNHKISKLMFHMPLATPIELVTPNDVGRAFANAPLKKAALAGKIFNLSGGITCQVIYEEFICQAFKNSGLGKLDFPQNAFATRNFHCGYYADGDDLENILHFRKDSLHNFYKLQQSAIPAYKKTLVSLFRKPIKMALVAKSEPLQAIRNKNIALINRFFGDDITD